jgi:hypothetical protein
MVSTLSTRSLEDSCSLAEEGSQPRPETEAEGELTINIKRVLGEALVWFVSHQRKRI